MSIAPTLLVAAMAVQISASLGLGSGDLGLAVSSFFAATAATTALLGRVVSRYGARAGLTAVMAVNAAVLLALSISQSIWMVIGALLVGGIANGAVHPASNAVLAAGMRGHLGLALGIKQSSMPAAALAGGLAVPLIALTVGWRWAFVLASMCSIGLMVAALRYRPADPPRAVRAADQSHGSPPPRMRLKLLSAGVCFGAAAGTSVNVFLVDASVQSQILAPAAAGLLAAFCGALAVGVRVGLGRLADRHPDTDATKYSVVLLVVCVMGAGLMATGIPAAFMLGAVLAAGLGFGWTGLVHLSAMRSSTTDAARTTGTLMTGMATGSCLGPLLLGQVAAHWDYRPVWVCAAVLTTAAALMLATVAKPHPTQSTGVGR